jgi:hypothetical protein
MKSIILRTIGCIGVVILILLAQSSKSFSQPKTIEIVYSNWQCYSGGTLISSSPGPLAPVTLSFDSIGQMSGASWTVKGTTINAKISPGMECIAW